MGSATATASRFNYEGVKLQRKIVELQEQMKKVRIMTERRKKAMGALHSAFEYCGYDLDSLMSTKCRERTIADLRSIAWSVYQNETSYSAQQISLDFDWNRSTVFCAIKRAQELRFVDRDFSDMYDAIHGAFINYLYQLPFNSEREQ